MRPLQFSIRALLTSILFLVTLLIAAIPANLLIPGELSRWLWNVVHGGGARPPEFHILVGYLTIIIISSVAAFTFTMCDPQASGERSS